jgi:tRNA-Thr(GGU) m(6)t(6)A37 methyltransferase TsaA
LFQRENAQPALVVQEMRFSLMSIGHVATDASHEELRHRATVSKIVIDRKFAGGLRGLQGFSHIYVLFLLHEAPKWKGNLTVHPRGRADIDETGVFATRSPHRPNPIALTLVKLLRKRGRVLTVKGLDAYDGTPVLDLKPYDRRDSAPRPRVPLWWKKLEHGSRRRRRGRNTKLAQLVHRAGRFGSKTR